MIHIFDPEQTAETATEDAIALSTTIRNGHVAHAWEKLVETLEDDPVRIASLALFLAALVDVDTLSSNALSWVGRKEAA